MTARTRPRGPQAPSSRAALVALSLFMLFGIACGAVRPNAGGTAPPGPAARVTSNVLRADYAGSDRCAPCHAEIFAAWQRSPMHRMTRVPEDTDVRAPFDGRVFRFKDDSARVTRHAVAGGVERFVELSSKAFGDHAYRVTRVIGGRYREDFAGVEVTAAAPGAPVVENHMSGHAAGAELILPLSYVFETASFRLKGYSVLVGERPGLRAGGVWNQTCVFCHNTMPYFASTWGELHGPGAPGYQGEVVDRLLPRDRRWTFEITDAAGFGRALADELGAIGADDEAAAVRRTDVATTEGRRAALAPGMRALRTRLRPDHLVELGVGCESCHGGARAHADEPRVLPDFAPRAAFLRARPPARDGEATRAEHINRACARCHQVLFSRYPFTWEGGERHGGASTAGGSSITSGEARDFMLGGCARQMSCVTCHDPHGEDQRESLARLATPAGNATCVRCHPALAGAEALRAHAHHDPAGAGGSCVACHMPRKNMGLGYGLTRYHRIGAPTERARVEADRPLECALCHTSETVASLVGTMERWWGKRYDRARLVALYGDLQARPLVATLARGKAHEQAVALAALGEARDASALPAAVRQLTNPFPLVRYYARRAVEDLRGAPCVVDLDRPTPEIEAAARRCVPAAFADPTAAPAGAAAPGPGELHGEFDAD